MAFWKNKENEESGISTGIASTPTSTFSTSQGSSPTPSPRRESSARDFSNTVSGERAGQSADSVDSKTGLCQPDDFIAQRHEKVRSALGPGTVIQGKLSFDTPVRIDGKLSGEVFSSRALIVGKSGQIDAKVEVASLIVYGSVKGTVIAAERVEIYEGGSVEGEIKCPAIMIESGARFNGQCDMGGRNASKRSSETKVISDSNMTIQPVYEQKTEEKSSSASAETRAPSPH